MAINDLAMPVPIQQFLDNSGAVVPGGLLFTYAAGGTVKTTTYTDATGATPNANPIVADASGRLSCYVPAGVAYRYVWCPATDTDPPTHSFWDKDNVIVSQQGIPWVVAGGAADVITASYTPTNISLTDGLTLSFRATAANATTTPTFAPDALTAHTITKKGGSALAIGDIPAALAEVIVRYNLANTRWELVNPAATKHILCGGSVSDTTGGGSTAYISVAGIFAAEQKAQFAVPFAGTVRNLWLRSGSVPGAGETYTYTVMKNGGATTLTCIMTAALAIISDVTHSFTVVAGDVLDVRLVTSAGATATAHNWSVEIDPT